MPCIKHLVTGRADRVHNHLTELNHVAMDAQSADGLLFYRSAQSTGPKARTKFVLLRIDFHATVGRGQRRIPFEFSKGAILH